MSEPLPLGPAHLVAAAALVAVAVALVRVGRLGLERDYLWAATRTVAQLLLVGYVLRWIFAADALLWVLAAFAAMLAVASRTAAKRVKRPPPGLLSAAAIALAVGSGVTTFAVTALRGPRRSVVGPALLPAAGRHDRRQRDERRGAGRRAVGQRDRGARG